MTADERLEALLNRAGQTISDLPINYRDNADMLISAFDAAYAWRDANGLEPLMETAQYILHLTDVIDRMEAALENVLNERDWRIQEYAIGDCNRCQHSEKVDDDCLEFRGCAFEFVRIPEDWRIDDEID